MKKLNVAFIVGMLSSLLRGSSVDAATLHVAPSGANTNPGTEQQPFLTIQRAVDAANAGDVVFVRTGVYPERVRTKINGTLDSPITLKAQSGVTNHGWDIRHSYITVDGFNIPGNTNVPNFSGAFEVNRGLNTIKILNNKVHDFDPIATKIYGVRFMYASNAEMATANVVISNNVFKNTSYIMTALVCSNALVCNNVYDFANTRDAIHCFGRKITICDNLFTNMSANPLVADHTDIIQTFGNELIEAYEVVFERNFIVNCDAQLCQLEQKGRPNIRDWTFRNNVFVNVKMGGNVDIENCRWHNNTFYRCTRTTAGPVLLNCNPKGCSDNAEVFNNIFFECGSRPDSVQMGWYHPENTNFVFTADYNFVAGTNGAPKGATFKEVHGINGGNPGFVNPEGFDFRLRPDSILLGKGVAIQDMNDDIMKSRRSPTGPWDIGAYQLPRNRPAPPGALRVVTP